jgi:hypothetical protein
MWIVDERLILRQPGLLKLMIYVLTFHIARALLINTSSQSGGRKDDSRPNFVFLCLLSLSTHVLQFPEPPLESFSIHCIHSYR